MIAAALTQSPVAVIPDPVDIYEWLAETGEVPPHLSLNALPPPLSESAAAVAD